MLERRRDLVRERQSRFDREWVPELVRPSTKKRQVLHKEQVQDKKVEEHMLALVLELNHKQSEEEQLEHKTVQERERMMVEEQQERKMAEERLEHTTVQELERMMAEEQQGHKKAEEQRKIVEELEHKIVEELEHKTVVVESKMAEELGDRRVVAGRPK